MSEVDAPVRPHRTVSALSPALTPPDGISRTLIRGSSLLLLGRLVSLALNFVVQVLTVRYLAKSDYGAFAYGMGVVSTGATAVLLGQDKAASRFVAVFQEQGDVRKAMGTVALAMTTVWGLGLSLVLLFYALQGVLGERVVTDPMAMSLLLILVALVPVAAFDSLMQRLLAVFVGARAIFFRRHLLGPGLKLCAVLLVIAIGGDARLLAWGYLAGSVIGILAYAGVLRGAWKRAGLLEYVRLRANDVPVRAVLLYSLPLLSSELVLVLRDSLSVILLGHLQTIDEVAEYQAVIPAAKLNLIVMQSFSVLFLPAASRLFARQDRHGMNELYWQTALWIALLSFPLFAGTVTMAKPIVSMLFGPEYAASAPVLAVLGVGHYIHASLGFNALTLRVSDKGGYIMAIDAATLILGLVLNLLLIPRFGALGAAFATSATFVIHNVLNNIGLHVAGTGVRVVQWRFLRAYMAIAGMTTLLALLHWGPDPPLPLALGFIVAATILLIRSTRHIVRPAEMFPELRRFRVFQLLLSVEPATGEEPRSRDAKKRSHTAGPRDTGEHQWKAPLP